ncbi:uncharacterized protein VTP21DRAFT_4188 [Calcarisporiella thermophila]|uniref:uncharacterized protein n=1 Tax=Calcarisporiella thermophila TaxID=911321 RepID=UPI003742D2D6
MNNTNILELEESIYLLNSAIASITTYIYTIPGSAIVFRYIKDRYRDDPFRVVLELFLVFFALRYLLAKKYRIGDNSIKLTEREVDELVEEWQPEPLVPQLTEQQKWELTKVPIISGGHGHKVKLVNGKTQLLNLASYNFLGLVANEEIKEKAIKILRSYGVGACGPPGFYGTLDVHMQLEKDLAQFLGTTEAIIYAQGFATISSTIAAFSKRGDIIVVDEGVNFGIQKGCQISRSIVRWYKHNDMEDLERVLEEIRVDQLRKKKPLTRRFIVTEGLFANYGDITPLPKLIELKKKYRYRLILDESFSIGVLGKRGAGLTDHFDVSPSEVDMIVGSMCNAFGSSGGFCAGNTEIVDHQRLSGNAYVFSAALPAMLAVSTSEALSILSKTPSLMTELQAHTRAFYKTLTSGSLERLVTLSSDPSSPMIHMRIRETLLHRYGERIGREEEERILQDIVDEASQNGVLLTRAKYVVDQERDAPRPSIRICVCAALTRKENDRAAGVVKSAVQKVLSKRR